MKKLQSRGSTLIFVILFIASVFFAHSLYLNRTKNWYEGIGHIASLTPRVANTIALEFKGILSDYLMLQTSTFMGAKLIEGQTLTQKEWQIVYLALKQVTTLDPRFIDPYVTAEFSLPFEGGMVEETNTLLLRATKARSEDHRPFFYLWYNYFYLQKDLRKAAFFLEQAAKKADAPSYYATLAARTHLYAGQLLNSITFLQEMLKQATDSKIKKYLQKRLEVTKKIAFLQYKVKLYKEKKGNLPTKIEDLLVPDILQQLPTDPFGGKFFIMENGRVYTTSDMVTHKNKKSIPPNLLE